MALLLFLGSWLALEAILRFKPVEQPPPATVKQPEAEQERPLAGQLLNMSKALDETRGETPARQFAVEKTQGERHIVD